MSDDDADTTLRRQRGERLLVAHPQEPRLRAYTESADPLLGSVIDNRYEIHRLLGSGGMANVYLGTHAVTGARLAVKVVDVKKQKNLKLRDRLLQEARSTMEISSNYVARAYDVGALPDGRLYVIQEYLDGEDLECVLEREGPLPWPRVAAMALDVCSGLSAAHRHGIIHRDVKPGNCFRVTMDGNPDHVKLIDFGIARDERDEVGLTQEGILLGTPEYTAPEMIVHGTRANPQTDVYSLGITLYKLLTGTTPFRGDDAYDILQKHIHQPLMAPSREAPHLGIPPDADLVVARALEKEPARRYSNADEMAASIRTALAAPQKGHQTVETAQLSRKTAQPAPLRPRAEVAASAPEGKAASAPTPLPPKQYAAPKPIASVSTAPQPSTPISEPFETRSVDLRATAHRAATLVLLASFFVIGTWAVIPVEEAQSSPPENMSLGRPPSPAVHTAPTPPHAMSAPATLPPAPRADIPAGPPQQEPPPPSPAPREEPVASPEPPPPEPAPKPEPELPPESIPAPEPAAASGSSPATPRSTEAEFDFNYKAAKRLIEDEHSYLRNTCMNKGDRPLTQLKFRVDVRPSGMPTIKISAAAPVRECVRADLSFPFGSSPRGGAFIYTLTMRSASIEPVPLAAAPAK